MVKLLDDLKGSNILSRYSPQLEKEYSFWMRGAEQLSIGQAAHRVVKLEEDVILNRYWDEQATPRPEAYKEDVELSHQSNQKPEQLYRNLRAAAESGWDFSSRWFEDEKDFGTIHTTDIVPVDLNCLLYHLELTLAEAHQQNRNQVLVEQYSALAKKRKSAILKYCWSAEQNFFVDYDFVKGRPKKSLTAAGVFPLFFQLATTDQAAAVSKILASDFIKPGGLTTTLQFSGQQWDAPNGWAPLQWIAFQGLMRYDFHVLANTIKLNWMNANEKVFHQTGKMTEKYDAWNENAEASGGEYPNQDGFGWTNGVYLAMLEK
jgi:alpha,alpha-trehalase